LGLDIGNRDLARKFNVVKKQALILIIILAEGG
jgi:hypothetical protein